MKFVALKYGKTQQPWNVVHTTISDKKIRGFFKLMHVKRSLEYEIKVTSKKGQ
jgi:hypothetical protein